MLETVREEVRLFHKHYFRITITLFDELRTLTDLQYNYRIGFTTACKVVQDLRRANLVSNERGLHSFPTPEMWNSIAFGYQTSANFPTTSVREGYIQKYSET